MARIHTLGPMADSCCVCAEVRTGSVFSVLSDEVQPTIPDVSQRSDIQSFIDALEFDLSRDEDPVQHHAMGTWVPASDLRVLRKLYKSPTNINDFSFEAEDVSEALFSLGAAGRAAMERFDDVDLKMKKSLPNFLRGVHRCAMRFAQFGRVVTRGLTRGWKMIMLLPRLLFDFVRSKRWLHAVSQGRGFQGQVRRARSDDRPPPCGRHHSFFGVSARTLHGVQIGAVDGTLKTQWGRSWNRLGDVVRRLVATTIAQQLIPAVQLLHPQTLTDLSDTATVISMDGIGVFDLISRGALLEGLRSVLGDSVLPFVLQFYGNPS